MISDNSNLSDNSILNIYVYILTYLALNKIIIFDSVIDVYYIDLEYFCTDYIIVY